MNRIFKFLLLIVTLIFTQGGHTQMFVGYDSFCGLPVVVGSDPQQATARTDQYGNKFIHVDPSVMSNWSASRIFVLAHECAHHLLGHTNKLGQLARYYGGTKRQELEADCWAANVLEETGHNFDITRTMLEHANRGHFATGGYPSGRERASNISNCAGGVSCDLVEVPEEYVDYEWAVQQAQIPCQHCGCDNFGRCGCQHPFDFVSQKVEVPVKRVRNVIRKVCY